MIAGIDPKHPESSEIGRILYAGRPSNTSDAVRPEELEWAKKQYNKIA